MYAKMLIYWYSNC